MNTLEQTIGNTPLVKLQRMGPDNGSEIWVKLEGNNPAGAVKDRAALSMSVEAEKRGEIQPGDVLIEADLNAIKEAGHPATTMMILTNTDLYDSVECAAPGTVTGKSSVMKLTK